MHFLYCYIITFGMNMYPDKYDQFITLALVDEFEITKFVFATKY